MFWENKKVRLNQEIGSTIIIAPCSYSIKWQEEMRISRCGTCSNREIIFEANTGRNLTVVDWGKFNSVIDISGTGVVKYDV